MWADRVSARGHMALVLDSGGVSALAGERADGQSSGVGGLAALVRAVVLNEALTG